MAVLDAFRPRLAALLGEAVEAHGVPGAVCGVVAGGASEVVAHGIANLGTGVEATPDTLFQIGSITKLYTTTLVMQAQSAGVLGLDEPVRAQLQEFSVADPGATLEITPRHLLTHTSGIAGDHLHDTGANQDTLMRYVATLAALGQVHAPDEAYSFCNTGFGVLGRLIEVTTGQVFDRALRHRLVRPLGCTSTLTMPRHLLLRRVAAGHMQEPGGPARRQGRWTLTRSNGPMGGIVCTAGDLLAFARMHLESGVGADGNELLPPAAVALMQEPHTDTPVPGEGQALGWSSRRWGDTVVLGQDADTFGQRAFLRMVPSAGFAIAVLTNSPPGEALARDLIARVAGELLDLPADEPCPLPQLGPDATAGLDLGRYVGTYGRLHQRVTIALDGDGLRMSAEPSGVLAALGDRSFEAPLRPVDPGAGVFAETSPATGVDHVVAFTGGDDAYRYVHVDGRLHRRMV